MHSFVATNTCLSRQNTSVVATKVCTCLSQQKFCHDKNILSRQIRFCGSASLKMKFVTATTSHFPPPPPPPPPPPLLLWVSLLRTPRTPPPPPINPHPCHPHFHLFWRLDALPPQLQHSPSSAVWRLCTLAYPVNVTPPQNQSADDLSPVNRKALHQGWPQQSNSTS